MHRSQILGTTIRQLRRMALGGASVEEIDAFLELRSFGRPLRVPESLDRAFLQRKLFMYRVAARREDTYANWAALIQERRAEWERDFVPELMRLRDYFSFMQFAQQERVLVLVCAANPAAGQWIGRPGIRCYDGALPVVSRVTAPNEGLLAADPTDPRLQQLLNAYEKPLTYADYVELLRAQGLRVAHANSGYLLEDALGLRFHEEYRLHGVYDAETNESAWTSKNAQRLRAALNRQLGAELVRFGPHDDWEFKNDRAAGPFFGPQIPALFFDHDQYISEVLTSDDLSELPPYRFRWNDLYPHHPIR
ncbi:MAG TPA: hypothetical protein VFK05_26545 [Polyangiaceae bacterium]|nr:hypothetical protein [Polyangiaceae bacterium]